ncbi:MAG: hypothetical protein ABI144_07545, partial [Gallionella sp.]
LERKRTTLEAQIAMLHAEFAVQEVASMKVIGQENAEKAQLAQGRVDMGLSRNADAKPGKPNPKKPKPRKPKPGNSKSSAK